MLKNLADIVARLREAASEWAQLVVFPECALSGYGFSNLESAPARRTRSPGGVPEKLAWHQLEIGRLSGGGLSRADVEAVYKKPPCSPWRIVRVTLNCTSPICGVDRLPHHGSRAFKFAYADSGCIDSDC
jgi:hypothetical protein